MTKAKAQTLASELILRDLSPELTRLSNGEYVIDVHNASATMADLTTVVNALTITATITSVKFS